MIDIRDYDLALVERFKAFYANTHWVNRPQLPLQELRDRKVLNGEDVKFPIVVIRRTNCPIFSTEYNSWSRAKSGQTFLTGEHQTGYMQLQDYDIELANKIMKDGHKDALSLVNSTFTLTYYLDVIALERDNFDTILVELQENLFRNPFIDFNNLKSDGSQDRIVPGQACHLFVEEIEDTSDLENFDSGNALYRATITLKINAYIYRKYRSVTVDIFNISSNVIPIWLKDKGLTSISEYLQSEYALEKLKLAGYKDINDYIHHLGYESFDDFLDAFNKGNETSVIFDLSIGPDGIILVFKIPPNEDEDTGV
jgi:hypothetical protein